MLTEGKGLTTFGLLTPGGQPSTWEGLLSAECPGREGLPTTVPSAGGVGRRGRYGSHPGGDCGLKVVTVNRQRTETEGPRQR